MLPAWELGSSPETLGAIPDTLRLGASLGRAGRAAHVGASSGSGHTSDIARSPPTLHSCLQDDDEPAWELGVLAAWGLGGSLETRGAGRAARVSAGHFSRDALWRLWEQFRDTLKLGAPSGNPWDARSLALLWKLGPRGSWAARVHT